MNLADRIQTAIQTSGTSQKAIALAANCKPSSISQLVSGRTKSMSAAVAYAIAKLTNVDMGWLLHGRGLMRPQYARADEVMERSPLPTGSGFPVPHLDVTASMGNGQYVNPEHEVVRYLGVDLPALRRQVSFSSAGKLNFISGRGDSMEPTFCDGDPLLIDTGVREHTTDAIYVVTLNGCLYVKTLQRRPDGLLLMISDNRKYDAYIIQPGDEFQIHGRVLLAWRARRL